MFLHIFLHNNDIHNNAILDVVKELNGSNHIFYKLSSIEKNDNHEDNVIFFNRKEVVGIINEKGPECRAIFIHSMTLSLIEIYKIKMSCLQKIVWVVWGHDLYSRYYEGYSIRKFRNILKHGYFSLYDMRLKYIKAIGIGFIYDGFEIRKRFKNLKIFRLPYGYIRGKKQMMEGIKTISCDGKKKIKVMIGHAAIQYNSHIEIMKKLEKFKHKDIVISLPLSYGDMQYAEEVKKYAKEHFGEKIEILNEKMERKQYCEYIASIDIAILNCSSQASLGNFNILAYFGKKIFLNKDGILMTAANFECMEVYTVDKIDSMSFTEFIEPVKKNEYLHQYGARCMNEDNSLDAWKKVFDELEYDERDYE